ncbi:alpha/beta-hydrolase [Xylaria grammica]|nr:alpha/beta-hydrolase [Xylaria grammica]
MSNNNTAGLELQRKLLREPKNYIEGPGLESFTSRFGTAFPEPEFLSSDLGVTALYSLPAPSGAAQRRVLLLHGLSTPALGLLPLARHLQALDPTAHVALYDHWGHGLSSTPLVPHTAALFHAQALQVLSFLRWTSADVVGYSFGAAMAAQFALHNPWAATSVSLLAPAGIVPQDLFGARLRELLVDCAGREAEARDAVFEFLEGGPLVVPPDWRERAQRGEVVAQALRAWELEAHAGYPHSVLSIFRRGNVYGCEDDFRELARLPVDKVVVLAELDPVCPAAQLAELGFESGRVRVVERAGHDVVRTEPAEVARIVYELWTR